MECFDVGILNGGKAYWGKVDEYGGWVGTHSGSASDMTTARADSPEARREGKGRRSSQVHCEDGRSLSLSRSGQGRVAKSSRGGDYRSSLRNAGFMY